MQNGLASKMEIKKSLKLLTRLLYGYYTCIPGTGILSGAGQVVKTNPETGEGRSDIVLEDSDNSRIVIFELKRTKKKEQMNASCEQALE